MKLGTRRSPPLRLQEGTVLGGYLVEGVLERSTAEELRYAARAPNGDPATIITPAGWQPGRRSRMRARRMASRRMNLKHPAVIAARAFGEDHGRPYLITDAYPQHTFGELLDREAPLPPNRVVALLAPVADALDLAHSRRLVHQALSSESLLIHAGRLQLDSFGVFRAGQESPSMLPSGDLRYRPPEEMRHEPLGPAANVYSLAAVIFHALTGAPPFAGEAPAMAYAHLTEPPPRPSERIPELGSATDDVIAWGMAKDASERPPTATALLVATGAARVGVRPRDKPESVQETPESSALEPATRPTGLTRRLGRGGARLAVAAVVAAALLGALAAALTDPFGGGDSPPTPRSAGAAAVERLEERRAILRSRLAAADTPADQTAIALQLARAYRAAAEAVRPGPFARTARQAAGVYAELALASEAGSASRFAAASQAVGRAERRLEAVASANR